MATDFDAVRIVAGVDAAAQVVQNIAWAVARLDDEILIQVEGRRSEDRNAVLAAIESARHSLPDLVEDPRDIWGYTAQERDDATRRLNERQAAA